MWAAGHARIPGMAACLAGDHLRRETHFAAERARVRQECAVGWAQSSQSFPLTTWRLGLLLDIE